MSDDVNTKYFIPCDVSKRVFADMSSKVKFLLGPIGTGKTVTGAMACLHFCDSVVPKRDDGKRRRAAILVVRQDHEKLKSSIVPTLEKWLPDGNRKMDYPITWDMTVDLGNGPIEIQWVMRGVANMDEEGKLRSTEYTCAWVSEAQTYDNPYPIIDAIYKRLGRFPDADRDESGEYRKDRNGNIISYMGQKMVIVDANYPSVRHPIYKLHKEKTPDGWTFYEYEPPFIEEFDADGQVVGYIQNPKADYVNKQPAGIKYWQDIIDMNKGINQAVIESDVMGRYATSVSGKPVYRNFKRELFVPNVSIRRMESRPVIVGYDHTGLNQACVFSQQGSKGIILLDELFVKDIGMTEFVENILVPYCNERGYTNRSNVFFSLDPLIAKQSDGLNAIQILQKLGFRSEPAYIKEIKPRIDLVQDYINKQQLHVNKECEITLAGLEGHYCYKKIRGTEVYKVAPDKDNEWSHTQDCVQYLCASYRYGYGRSKYSVNNPTLDKRSRADQAHFSGML